MGNSKLTGRLVRQLMAQFKKKLSHAKAEREHRVEQQNSKLRKLMVPIDRSASHFSSGAALKKLQKEVKAMKKKEGLTHLRLKKLQKEVKAMKKKGGLTPLRRAEEKEALERNKWLTSAIAVLKLEQEKQ